VHARACSIETPLARALGNTLGWLLGVLRSGVVTKTIAVRFYAANQLCTNSIKPLPPPTLFAFYDSLRELWAAEKFWRHPLSAYVTGNTQSPSAQVLNRSAQQISANKGSLQNLCAAQSSLGESYKVLRSITNQSAKRIVVPSTLSTTAYRTKLHKTWFVVYFKRPWIGLITCIIN